MKTFAVAALVANVSAIQLKEMEYPNVDIRGVMPTNAHPDSVFDSTLHNDWTNVQLKNTEYPTPNIRGPIPYNSHRDTTFHHHVHNDWTYPQVSR